MIRVLPENFEGYMYMIRVLPENVADIGYIVHD